jgi:hypothetical protein
MGCERVVMIVMNLYFQQLPVKNKSLPVVNAYRRDDE